MELIENNSNLKSSFNMEIAAGIIKNFNKKTTKYKVYDEIKEPKNGLFVLFYTEDFHKKENWRNDGYSWRYIGRQDKYINGSLFRREYHKRTDLDENCVDYALKKRIYRCIARNKDYPMIIHYTNEKLFKSMDSDLNVQNNNKCEETNKKHVFNENGDPKSFVVVPRDTQRAVNANKLVKNDEALHISGVAGDGVSLMDLFELDDVNSSIDFLRVYIQCPCVLAVASDCQMIELVNVLMRTKETNSKILFQYDVTYSICNYYLTILYVKSTIFNEEPLIPFAFLISDHDSCEVHLKFFKFLKQSIEQFESNSVIVVNNTYEIKNAIRSVFPSVECLCSWDGLFSSFNSWFKTNKYSNEEKELYVASIITLLNADSYDLYEKLLYVEKTKWDTNFANYFMKLLGCCISAYGKWSIKKYECLYNEMHGLKPFKCPKISSLIELMRNRIVPISVTLKTLYNLQLQFLNEIKMSLSDNGIFKLKSSCAHLKQARFDTRSYSDPFEVINKIKEEQTYATIPSDDDDDENNENGFLDSTIINLSLISN